MLHAAGCLDPRYYSKLGNDALCYSPFSRKHLIVKIITILQRFRDEALEHTCLSIRDFFHRKTFCEVTWRTKRPTNGGSLHMKIQISPPALKYSAITDNVNFAMIR